MNYYSLEPEVACELGDKTILDANVRPPIVTQLHCHFQGWLGDDLLAVYPCYIVTEKLKNEIENGNLTGYEFEDIIITKSEIFEEMYPNRDLGQFYRMKITGEEEKSDFYLLPDTTLRVSDKALNILKKVNLENCDIE